MPRRRARRRREHDVAVRQVRRLIEIARAHASDSNTLFGCHASLSTKIASRHERRARMPRARRRDSRGSRRARSRRPTRSACQTQPRIGRPATSTMHFGISSVCAPSRLPRPAAIRIARVRITAIPRGGPNLPSRNRIAARLFSEIQRVDRAVDPEVQIDAVQRRDQPEVLRVVHDDPRAATRSPRSRSPIGPRRPPTAAGWPSSVGGFAPYSGPPHERRQRDSRRQAEQAAEPDQQHAVSSPVGPPHPHRDRAVAAASP